MTKQGKRVRGMTEKEHFQFEDWYYRISQQNIPSCHITIALMAWKEATKLAKKSPK